MQGLKNQCTDELFESLQNAYIEARSKHHTQIECWHLLFYWLKKSNFIQKFLKASGLDIHRLKIEVHSKLANLPKLDLPVKNLKLSESLEQTFYLGISLRERYQSSVLSSAILILTWMEGSDEVSRLLKSLGADFQKAHNFLKKSQLDGSEKQSEYEECLKTYTLDLTKKAQEGSLDPVIGRDEEIRRVMQVLQRRTKNNPVLVGAPGVGKSAVVEGIAQRIINCEVPDSLRDKKILALDLGLLLAGASFRGDFEKRVKKLIEAIQFYSGSIILFIDEIHTLVHAGAGEGSVKAADMLKPSLARGELRCIGATTFEEYKRYVEADAALERRFQKIILEEPSVKDTISILRGVKERYALHHHVHIKDSAIVAAAKLSARYISGRFLPDKAIDLIDEAASAVRIQMDSKPDNIDRLERQLMQLRLQKKMLEKESDPIANAATLKKLDTQISDFEQELNILMNILKREKAQTSNIQALRQEQEQQKRLLEQANRRQDLEEIGRIQYGVLPELEKQIKEKEECSGKHDQEPLRLLKFEVTPKEVMEVISRWTGIPIQNLELSEKEKLLKMEDSLSARVLGQRNAVCAISNAIRRNRAGLSELKRPIGSFLCLGPTGVGKTELARSTAKFLFDSEDAMIRIDMSEYMDAHNVSRLIGAPPGYVGYERGGTLTEAVRTRPYSVLLFDELEKAHPDVFHLFLQILEEGNLTDSQGNVVNFANTVIFLTSNLASDLIHRSIKENVSRTVKSERILNVLKSKFRPEFLNRLDEILIFDPLGKTELKGIVNLQLNNLRKKLKNIGYILNWSEAVSDYLLTLGYNSEYGARPLKRAIQTALENSLATQILERQKSHEKRIDINCIFDGSKLDIQFT